MLSFFLLAKNMATQKNKQKLAAVSWKTQKDARNSQAQNTFVPGMTQKCKARVSKESERKVTKKLSLRLSRTVSRILRALSRLDEFRLNPQKPKCSGTLPGTCRINNSQNREPTGDRRQNYPCPKAKVSVREASKRAESGQKETFTKTTAWFVLSLSQPQVSHLEKTTTSKNVGCLSF